ncbi:hypothetical protein [Myxococcus sp. Y35]|uniref:hypothetical protein n=1 Tax=Pseudomyxococcus flavus TaxID=3115648 RepID=UPI003CFB208A
MSTDAILGFAVVGTLPPWQGARWKERPMSTDAVGSFTVVGALLLLQGRARTGVTHVH